MAFQGATVYYYTPSEVINIGPTPDGKVVRISGKLVPASFEREAGSVNSDLTSAISLDSLPH